MAIDVKSIDITNEGLTEQQWAEQTPGVFMNMLSLIGYDKVTGKYRMAPIKYSDANLEGETIRFAGGEEAIVWYSCLASDYANKTEIYDEWWAKVNEIKTKYIEMKNLGEHVKTHNVDLKKLRNEGKLLEKDEIGMK